MVLLVLHVSHLAFLRFFGVFFPSSICTCVYAGLPRKTSILLMGLFLLKIKILKIKIKKNVFSAKDVVAITNRALLSTKCELMWGLVFQIDQCFSVLGMFSAISA